MTNILKAIRSEMGLPIAAIAVRAKVGTATIVAIERHGHNPRLETKQRLADALGVAVERIWPAADRAGER